MTSQRNTELLQAISEDLLRFLWSSKPVEASLCGIHDYDACIGDISAATLQKDAAASRAFLRRLEEEIDSSSLDPESLIDYRLAMSLAGTNDLQITGQRHWMKNPGIYPSLATWACYSLIQQEFAPLEDRMCSVLSRMKDIPETLQISKTNIADVPKVFADTAIEVAMGGVHFFQNIIPLFAEKVPTLQADLLLESKRVVQAMESYVEWLRDDILPFASGDFAIGEKTYRQLVFTQHYLTYDTGNLLSLGETMLDAATREIKEVAAQIDPTISWRDLVSKLSMDHPPVETMVEAYREAIESARSFVIERDLVTIPSDENLLVVETPEFERSTLPFAAYYPPAPFDSIKTGRFWVTPVDASLPYETQMKQLAGHCTYTIPLRALHEGYPGHHVQMSTVVDVKSPFRKMAMSNLLIEGWAMYCEGMMHEAGFYSDPRVRLFQLKDVIWRACRVIIDVGLHTSAMTFEDAVRMLVDKTAMQEVGAIAEVKRYAMSPTQPMTYAIGSLLIKDIKARMKRRLGADFKLKAFHDRLLSYGSIPPPLIAQGIFTEKPKIRD